MTPTILVGRLTRRYRGQLACGLTTIRRVTV